jgi:hypothetical protein
MISFPSLDLYLLRVYIRSSTVYMYRCFQWCRR